MEKILQKLLSGKCLVYLNDVIVFGKSFEKMISNLREVFQQFRSANLKINLKKCNFSRREIRYLGYLRHII